MPVPSAASFVGVGKESVRGTAVAPTAFIPYTTIDSPNDLYHYADDTGNRGAPVDAYDSLPTQAWSEPSFGGAVYDDIIGYWLHCLMGEHAVIAPTSGVYPHTFTTLNSGDLQPPSYTITDYNGVNTPQIPGFLVSELAFQFTATGLLTYTVKGLGFKSALTSKPTPSFSAERATQAWTGVTTIAGVATSKMQDGSITIARAVESVPTIGQQDPLSMWGDKISVTGQMNLVFDVATELNRYTGGTPTTFDINFTTGAGATLRKLQLGMAKVQYTAAKPSRGKSYVELPVTFRGLANTTDIGVSGGYGPLHVNLWNLISTY